MQLKQLLLLLLLINTVFGAISNYLQYFSGDNSFGQFGDSTNTSRLNFTVAADLPIISECGWYSSFFAVQESQLVASGLNSNGQLGTLNTQSLLTRSKINDYGFDQKTNTRIISGRYHTFIIYEDGSTFIHSIGNNLYGQLGNFTESTDQVTSFVTPVGLEGVINAYAGENHSLVLLSNGTLTSFGSNSHGQLCLGAVGDQFIPVAINLANVTAAAAGRAHSIILTAQNSVPLMYACGNNEYGQLGIGNFINQILPTLVGVKNATAASAWDHTVVVSDYGVYSFGLNSDGQLGAGNTTNLALPFKIPVPNAKYIAVGSAHTLVATKTTFLYAFGNNTFGQLGDLSTTSSSTPKKIPNLRGIYIVKAGFAFSSIEIPDPDSYSCYGVKINDALVCSGHGGCQVDTTVDHCICEEGYSGIQCEFTTCNGINATDTSVCNSRGNCTTLDSCVCTSNYTGAECEFPICYGKSSNDSSVCSSSGTCIAPNNCSCSNAVGENCEIPICFGKNASDTNVCSGRGICESFNICNCSTSGYVGTQCEIPICYGKNASDSTVCSGYGICSSKNNCTCLQGYFENNCDAFTCSGQLFNTTDACGSFGNCTSLNTCTCYNGYNGTNCDLFQCFGINSTDENVCSNHGNCSTPDNCICDLGYTGTNCISAICFGHNSTDAAVCSGRGNCSSPNTCNCGEYAGTQCELNVCFGKFSNDSSVCSSFGACNDTNNCTCDVGYSGSDCSNFSCFGSSAFSESVCSNNGNCTAPDACSCEVGYSGKNCEFTTCHGKNSSDSSVCSSNGNCTTKDTCSCMNGYIGNECQTPICFGTLGTNASVCSSKGSCISPNICNCSFGYIGSKCETPICFNIPGNNSNVCNSNGVCTAYNMCNCTSGFTGSQCSTNSISICFGKNSSDPTVCSGIGNCTSNFCVCPSGKYEGNECEYPICKGLSHEPSVPNPPCLGRGNCTSPDTCNCNFPFSGNDCLSCVSGYSGQYCDIPICFGKNASEISVCSGNGICSSVNNCTCKFGSTGNDCSSYTCFGDLPTLSTVCSKNGECVGPNKCACNTGYSGNQCEIIECFGLNSSNSNVCSGNGQCSGYDRCICFEGFGGNNCSINTTIPAFASPNCVIVGNEFIQYQKREKTYFIQVSACSPTTGYSGISIHNGDTSDSLFNVIAWVSSSEGKTYIKEISHEPPYTNIALKDQASTGVIIQTKEQLYSQYQYFNKKKFIIEVDTEQLKKYNSISVVCSDTPISGNATFKYHGNVNTKKIQLTETTSICDLTSIQGGFSKRFSDTSVDWFVFELGVYIILFIIVIYFRDLQPLASRGIVPLIVIFSQYGASFTSFQNFFFTLEEKSRYSCMLHAFFYENMLSVIFLLMPLNYLRYVMLININKNKEYMSKKLSGGSLYFKFITFLRKAVTTPVTVSVIIVFLILFGMVDGIILLFGNPFVCDTGKSYAIRFIHLVFNFIFGIIFLSIGCIDLTLNVINCIKTVFGKDEFTDENDEADDRYDDVRKAEAKKNAIQNCGKGILNFYFYDDPFYFRIEQIMAAFVFGLYAFLELFAFVGLFGTGTENAFYFYFAKTFDIYGRSIVTYLFIVYQAIIPLIVSLIKALIIFIKSNSYTIKLKLSTYFPKAFNIPSSLPEKENLGEIERLLLDPEIYKMFLVFAKGEWSAENVLCFGDIQKYKRFKNIDKKANLAFHIHEIYLNGSNSPMEINIDTKTREKVYKKMNELEFKFDNDLFEPIAKALVVNLSDTYSRFILTNNFSNYVKNKEFQDQQMKDF